MTGKVLNITRFATDDGPGIRTTVFLKGCPLKCIWCHNPESQKKKTELMFDAEKCVMCGACGALCENGCHTFEGKHIFDREKCIACGKCTEICPKNALTLYGREMSAEDIVSVAVRDKAFYRKDGGITVSGGEPLFQADFTAEILKLSKKEGLNTAIETSGFADGESVEKVIQYTDIVLFDIKETDEALHKWFTGAPLDVIINNLKKIDKAGVPIILRLPVIPGLNDRAEHFERVKEIKRTLSHCIGIQVMPYHMLGKYKYALLGREYQLSEIKEPDNETKEKWKSFFE